jgi:hypothetical protein
MIGHRTDRLEAHTLETKLYRYAVMRPPMEHTGPLCNGLRLSPPGHSESILDLSKCRRR